MYPLQFTRYFIWPNFIKYYAPPVEFLEQYNMGRDTVTNIAMGWFGYKTKKVKTAIGGNHVYILNFYPILAGTMNILFLFGFLFFIMLGGLKKPNNISKGLLLASGVWLINLIFSVFASSVALRFQAFPILMVFSFAFLLIDYIIKIAWQPEVERKIDPRRIPIEIAGQPT